MEKTHVFSEREFRDRRNVDSGENGGMGYGSGTDPKL